MGKEEWVMVCWIHNGSDVLVVLDSAVGVGHIFEPLPSWVLLVELAAVVGEEENGEDCEEDAPGGSPETDVVDEGLVADSVVEDGGGQHEVEGDGVLVVDEVVHLRDLFVGDVQLDVLRVLAAEPVEVVRQHLGPHHLETDGYPFVEPLDQEEVGLQVVVPILASDILRYRALVPHLLHKQEDPSEVGQLVEVIAGQTSEVSSVLAETHLDGGVDGDRSAKEQSPGLQGLLGSAQDGVELLCGIAHPVYLAEVGADVVAVGHLADVDRHCILVAHCLNLGRPAVRHELGVEVGLVVVRVVGHEGHCEGGQRVVLIVEGRPVALDARRVVAHEMVEVVDHVGQDDGEEDGRPDQGCPGGDGVVLGHGDEGEDVDSPQHAHTYVGLLSGNKGLGILSGSLHREQLVRQQYDYNIYIKGMSVLGRQITSPLPDSEKFQLKIKGDICFNSQDSG